MKEVIELQGLASEWENGDSMNLQLIRSRYSEFKKTVRKIYHVASNLRASVNAHLNDIYTSLLDTEYTLNCFLNGNTKEID